MFPTLTPAQVKRIAVHGQVRSIRLGEVLIEAGEQVVQLCRGEEVVVVGGGNSAGQAAVFLAQTTKRVHMLMRGTVWPKACRAI